MFKYLPPALGGYLFLTWDLLQLFLGRSLFGCLLAVPRPRRVARYEAKSYVGLKFCEC